ncbi:unnamed protein product [Victoria cruziana]
MTVPDARKDLLMVNMGPHHLSMRGVLRLIVTLDGKDVIDYEPILGYLHRAMKKIAENRTIIQYLPYVICWDYLATMFTEAITVNAPEELGNIQVPKRASYIRIIMLELSCIASHLLWLEPFMADIGAQTPFFYIFRERELLYDLFEAATDKCLDFCNYFLMGVIEYQKLITRNAIFLERVEGVGPMLRAFGIQWDLHKFNRYECYDEFDWEVQWQKEGDSLAHSELNDFEYRFISKKPSPSFELSKQELYVRVEAPKGELSIFLIGDNIKRMKLANIITILGSIDIIMGEVDR